MKRTKQAKKIDAIVKTFDSTYKELKHRWNPSGDHDGFGSFDSTYKELKPLGDDVEMFEIMDF